MPSIKTEDGYIFHQQADGSWSDGDLTYQDLDDLGVAHTVLPNEPCKVRTEDGYTFKKQTNGSYRAVKGNATIYCSTLEELKNLHTIIPSIPYKYEVNQKLWYNGDPVRVTNREATEDHGTPIYYIDNPNSTPHKNSPAPESCLTNEHAPDKNFLKIGDRIVCYGTSSKIQATFDWTLNTRIYLVYNADGQTKWATRHQIHKFNTKQNWNQDNENILPLGSVFWVDNNQWVDNHGIVETHEGPGLKYWIEWDNDGFDNKQYIQVPADQLKTVTHWDPAYKLGDLVTLDTHGCCIVYRITNFESTRRTRDGGGPDEEVIYRIFPVGDTRTPTEEITTVVAQYELGRYVPHFDPGDRVRVSDKPRLSAVARGKYGFILESNSEDTYRVAMPAGQCEESQAARIETIAATFLTLEEK
jgi:hypothetical protein